jgi:hypothetical protein
MCFIKDMNKFPFWHDRFKKRLTELIRNWQFILHPLCNGSQALHFLVHRAKLTKLGQLEKRFPKVCELFP